MLNSSRDLPLAAEKYEHYREAGLEWLNKCLARAEEEQLIFGGAYDTKFLKQYKQSAYDLEWNRLDLKLALHGIKPKKTYRIESSWQPKADGVLEILYGRDEEEKDLLNFLLNTQQGVKIVNIRGEAGIGKTAFAALIYSSASIVASFPLRLWLTLPPGTATLSDAVVKILETLTGERRFCPQTQGKDLQLLLSELGKVLARCKFLLVLDNCWINDDSRNWGKMIASLGLHGSAILILTTTRILGEGGEEEERNLGVHDMPLPPLTREHCCSILLNERIDDLERIEPDDCREELAQLGFNYIDKLGCLPMAAKMVGSLLRDQGLDFWDCTLEHRLLGTRCHWSSQIPSFLMLCYIHLPVGLRQCFKFLSVFPKGHRFQQKQLVQLWMALGFLPEPQESGRSMEDTGSDYFRYLTLTSFFQPLGDDGVWFTIHDTVHDLASYLFRESGEREFYYHGRIDNFQHEDLFHHTLKGIWLSEPSHGQLSAEELDVQVLSKFRINILGALSLSRTTITDLSPSITTLCCLRYLDLSYTALRALPDSVGDLNHLQTLLLTNCISLTTLPERLTNLKSLRHLDITGTSVQQMPPGMHTLENLQTLTDFVVSRSYEGFQDLATLTSIRTLTISNPNHVKHNCSVKFRGWQYGKVFQTLHSLKLFRCGCTSLPSLGQLQCLKDLVIEGFYKVTQVGTDFCASLGASKAFASLESLQFRDMPEWEKWSSGDVEFQKLRVLSLICCPKLVGKLPGNLEKLEKLEISGCVALEDFLPEMKPTCRVHVQDCNEPLMTRAGDKSPKSSNRLVMIPVDGMYSAVRSNDPDNMRATSSSGDEPSYSEMVIISSVLELEEKLPSELKNLRIEDCFNLEDLPKSSLTKMQSLKELYLINCPSFKPFSQPDFPVSLKTLYISNCTALDLFPTPDSTSRFKFLQHLCIGNSCESLEVFTFNFFPKLRTLCLWDCQRLKSFTISEGSQGDLACLKSIQIRDCPCLQSFPEGGLPTPNMASLLVSNCTRLTNIPNSKNSRLLSLQSLIIHGCPALEPHSLDGLPSSMTSLSIVSCKNLKPQKSWGLHNLENLSSLEIEDVVMESFPDENLLPSNLNTLRISKLPSLKVLDGKGLKLLDALQALEIDDCKELQSLPEEVLPSSLMYLCIKQCDSLKQNLTSMAGKEWDKVAHIAQIVIDGEEIC